MGDHGAADACDVAGGERDAELRHLAVALFGGGEDVAVEQAHDVLEEEELGHRVRDLRGMLDQRGLQK